MIRIIGFLMALLVTNVYADEQHADDYITSFGIAGKITPKLFSLGFPKIIGGCVFKDGKFFPDFYFTLAVEQLIPDLVVSVYNEKDSNPYSEIKAAYENGALEKAYKIERDTISKTLLGIVVPSGDGSTSAQKSGRHGRGERIRIVDVVGAPLNFIHFPFISHNPEPYPLIPYYLSQADGISDRYELLETPYLLSHPGLALSSPIGDPLSLWGHEVPRTMRVNNPYRFRASVVAGMHGADIATNSQVGHIPTIGRLSNSCGQNCVISNVVYDRTKKNIIWQEVFPNNRIISPGDTNDLGMDDDLKGKGNYVFVVWRKYRGCLQAPGRKIWSNIDAGHPIKR